MIYLGNFFYWLRVNTELHMKHSIFLVMVFFIHTVTSAQEPIKEPRHYRVRVLLQQDESGSCSQWNVQSSQGFIMVDPILKTKHKIDARELSITGKKNYFLVNGTRIDQKKLYLCPVKGNLLYNGREYQGSFLLVADAQARYLINSLDIEDYVCSVLRTESWPGWPLEVNKVFAIASRSYVIGVILNNKNNTLPYHVRNTNKHQTYSGVHTDPVLKEAVEQTKGIFLVHDKKPIVAMFDSCCGGIVPAHIHGVNFAHAPYLARDYACTYCKDCRVYAWTAAYPIDHIESLFKKEHKNLRKIAHVKVGKTDKAGLVQHVHVKGGKRTYTIHGKRVYSMLDKVKSYYYDIIFDTKTITISGKGIGHHLGLCQWGAREMVRLGFDYKSVLNFYYPGTQFMRLQS